jgi:hypothetical protein
MHKSSQKKKHPFFLSNFDDTWNFLNRFSKNPKISNFMKICPVEAEFSQAVGAPDFSMEQCWKIQSVCRPDSIGSLACTFQQWMCVGNGLWCVTSLDISSCDFYLWEALMTTVYHKNLTHLEELQLFWRDMLRNVWMLEDFFQLLLNMHNIACFTCIILHNN